MGSGPALGTYFERSGMGTLWRVDSNPQFYKSGFRVGGVYPLHRENRILIIAVSPKVPKALYRLIIGSEARFFA